MKRGLQQKAAIAMIGLAALSAITVATVQGGAGDELAPSRAPARGVLAIPDSGPDLTAELTLDPASPGVGVTAKIRVTVRNKGTGGTGGGFFVHLYVNPPNRPPTVTVPSSYFWQLPALAAGGSSPLERNVTFATAGCDHIIYVWVDKANTIAESDEANNLVPLQVCVGVTCEADAYEPDNACAAAGWSSTGAVQDHTLCPVGDEDWIKFTAVAGTTYTVAATDLGAHAQPLLSLYQSCGGLSQFGAASQFQWFAPASGVYYIHVRHRDDTWGPLAGYKLRITAGPGSGDIYEPDDTCAAARDIPTDGTRQTHLFQGPGDQDWVKFAAASGEVFSVIADRTATGVSPTIALYNSCEQVSTASLVQGSPVQAAASMSQVYYVKVTNAHTSVYGPEAHYDLSVTAQSCTGDAFENDDNKGVAKAIAADGAAQTHTICPAGDQDWVQFVAQAGVIYVLQTSNLGMAADTYLHLYDSDGITRLAYDDDHGYSLGSRIVWACPQTDTYYARVHHVSPGASGAETHYELSLKTGRCEPDAHEPDNRFQDAPLQPTNGQTREHNFCADDDSGQYADQDWVGFQTVAGATYLIETKGLGADSDTVLELYDSRGVTLLASNDDHGPGLASTLSFIAPKTGAYYLRLRHFNSRHYGDETRYQLAITGAAPPTPTSTPTATPSPTPTATPTVPPSEVKTLILTNRQRLAAIFGTTETDALMAKVYQLADHPRVRGAVLQVETDAATAAAYDLWIASPEALLDITKANAVAGAVRNLAMSFLTSATNAEYIVIVGDDRIVPHRRVPEGNLDKTEHQYAPYMTANTSVWAAAQANMTLTDDFYADQEPTPWQDRELYLPDYAIARLVERPEEIVAFIDTFLSGDTITTSRALVTAYHFAIDGGEKIRDYLKDDDIVTDATLVGEVWTGAAARTKQLSADPRFDLQSINGHSTHLTIGVPNNDDIQASEIITASTDFARTIIYSMGCHSGLTDPGALDLPQAFSRRLANYVGNTGYGWGGGGVVGSEALMRNFTRRLVENTATEIGKALTAAKQNYYQWDTQIDPYEFKVLMETTLYGLPMYRITSGAVLEPDDPFPSAQINTTAPSAFGPVSVGSLDFGLPGALGAFGETTTVQGSILALDESSSFEVGQPIQPRFYAPLSAANAGSLHGIILRSGVYSDVTGFDPVIAQPLNEYVIPAAEPAFDAPGWHPALPFLVRSNSSISTTAQVLVASLGQFDSASGTERLYDQLAFDAFYSNSPDTIPPTITHVDGVLGPGAGTARIKVETDDSSGILKVVAAYTTDQGTWQSGELAYDAVMWKWTGTIPATVQTRFFVQVVDRAGNVAVDNDKGRYRALFAPLPPVGGLPSGRVYLPLLMKGG